MQRTHNNPIYMQLQAEAKFVRERLTSYHAMTRHGMQQLNVHLLLVSQLMNQCRTLGLVHSRIQHNTCPFSLQDHLIGCY